jgi:hypothetical protein
MHWPVLMSTQPVQGEQLPPTQVLPALHEVQRLPPWPQRAGVVLVVHTPAAVQQPAQFDGPQLAEPPPPPVTPPPPPPVAPPPPPVEVLVHTPWRQAWLRPHARQVLPLRPHAPLDAPLLQVLPRQQPAQVLALQVEPPPPPVVPPPPPVVAPPPPPVVPPPPPVVPPPPPVLPPPPPLPVDWTTHWPKVHACTLVHSWQSAPPAPHAVLEPPG